MKHLNYLRKRGLALFMALVMCLSLVQVTAFADDDDNVMTGSGDIFIDNLDGQNGQDGQESQENQNGQDNSNLTNPDIQTDEPEHTHAWDNGTVTKDPTCTSTGEETFTCTAEDCNETKTETILPTEHDWDEGVVTTEATETETGEEKYTCTVCGETKTETTPATGAPAEVQAFLAAVDALYGVSDEEFLQAVEYAEGLYKNLTEDQQSREDVMQCKAMLDTARQTMPVDGTTAEVSDETALKDAIADNTVSLVKLVDNIKLDATLQISRTVTLDLNGKTLSGVGTTANTTDGSVIKVTGDGTIFTLMDSTGNNGTITGGRARNGGGVHVAAGAKFVMQSGCISGNLSPVVHDGTNRVWNCGGGGVYTAEGSFFEMTGGIITKNDGLTGAGVRSEGTFTMSGDALITENKTTNVGRGGGVCAAGSFTMTGGRITKNASANAHGWGGGIYIVGIWEENPENEVVLRPAEGCLTISGSAEISDNSGTGVFIGSGSADINHPALTISGDAKIINNTDRGVCTCWGAATVMNGGSVSNNTLGGFGCDGPLAITGGKINGNGSNDVGLGGGICMNGNSGTLVITGGEIYDNTAKAGGGIALGDCFYEDYVRDGGVLYPTDSYGKKLFHIEMTGGKIYNNTATEYGGGVGVLCCVGAFLAVNEEGWGSGTFEMSGGAEISGNTAPVGGGVYVVRAGTLKMSGGNISNNTAAMGGGVYVAENGTFEMSGNAEISGNDATSTGWNIGGGVCNYGTFTMAGGSITGNRTLSSGCNVGAGVFNGENGTFTLSSGTISRNTSVWDGGGVFNWGHFEMSGGFITENSGQGDGGGVWIENKGSFDMSGGEISDNEIAGYGGGVGVNQNTTFTMTGGVITRNLAHKSGGGVSNGAAINLAGETGFGGGITKITGGAIHNNHADVMGDDICNSGEKGSLTLSVAAATSGWKLNDTDCGSTGHVITNWFYDGYRPVEGGTADRARWDGHNDDGTLYAMPYTLNSEAEVVVVALKAAHGDPPVPALTLRYDANGGTGAPGEQKTTGAGAGLPVSDGVPTRSGYIFRGWNTSPDGTGTTYQAGNIIQLVDDTTLYAMWEPVGDIILPIPTPTPTPTPVTPVTPTPTPTGTTITDEEIPLAGAVGLNDTDHFAYIIGYEDDTVRPLNNISRAEVATIFFRLMTDEYRAANWATTNDFSDVAAGNWYNNAISTCANAGALTGYADGSFKPNANITRAEFAAIAARFLSDEYVDDGKGDFSDTADHWAAKEIRLAAKAGWVTGSGNKFRPNEYITRAEVMTIVNRMLDRTPDKDHMLPTMKVWPDNPESAWYYEAVQEATNEHDYERDDLNVETWTELLQIRDWKALETEWANNGGVSAT